MDGGRGEERGGERGTEWEGGTGWGERDGVGREGRVGREGWSRERRTEWGERDGVGRGGEEEGCVHIRIRNLGRRGRLYRSLFSESE